MLQLCLAKLTFSRYMLHHFSDLFENYVDSNIVDVKSYEELKAAISNGKWARGYWAGR